MDSDFFTEEEDVRREVQVRERMPFLHELLKSKLENSYKSRRSSSEKRKRSELPIVNDYDSEGGNVPESGNLDRDDDDIEAERVEGVQYVQEEDSSKSEAHRLRMVRD